MTRRRLLAGLLSLVVLGYAAPLAYLMSQETALVFRPGREMPPTRPEFEWREVEIPREDSARQIGWEMPAAAGPDQGPWLLYFHGNAAAIASRLNIERYGELRGLGLNLFAPEYRGFGGLDGTPSESSLAADARAAWRYLTDQRGVAPARIILFGWSLGSAVAVDLASHVTPAAVILEGAPASVVAIGARQYWWFPIRAVMRNRFESDAKIGRVGAPLLFLHSPEDRIIPIEEGRRLYERAPGEKTFVEVRGGHVLAHREDRETFFGAIRAFLEARELLPEAHHALER